MSALNSDLSGKWRRSQAKKIVIGGFVVAAALHASIVDAQGRPASRAAKPAAPKRVGHQAPQTQPSAPPSDPTLAPTAPELEPFSDACGRGEWRLEGAELRAAADAEVSYSAGWTPVLEQAASCLGRPEYERHCLRVQGQFDDVVFDERIVAVYGSREATQLARARARSSMVVAKLQQLGIGPDRLLHVHPGAAATFRGAIVVLSTECGFAPTAHQAEPVVAPPAAPAFSEAVLAQAIADRLKSAPSAPPKKEGTFHLDAGLSGSVLLLGDARLDDPFWLGQGVVSGGFFGYQVYARVDALVGIGGSIDRRFATDFGAAVGYYRSSLIQVGLRFRHHRASDRPRVDAFGTGFSLGIEAAQCLPFWGLDLCASEAFSPLGRYHTDVTLEDGEPARIPKVNSDLMRFDLSFFARLH